MAQQLVVVKKNNRNETMKKYSKEYSIRIIVINRPIRLEEPPQMARTIMSADKYV